MFMARSSSNFNCENLESHWRCLLGLVVGGGVVGLEWTEQDNESQPQNSNSIESLSTFCPPRLGQ